MSENIKKEDFDRLFRDVKNTISLSKDLFTVRSIQQQEFRMLFTQFYTENLFLKNQNEELKNLIRQKSTKYVTDPINSSSKTSKKKTTKKKVTKKKS